MVHRKIFIDVTIDSYAYERILSILAIVFAWFLYAIYNHFKLSGFSADASSISFMLITISVFLFLIISVVFLRKYWLFKVITSERGLTLTGLFKKEFIRWDEIYSLSVNNNFFIGNVAGGKAGEIKTKRRSYYFPLTMKEKGKVFPRFSGQIGKFRWKDEKGNKEPITHENCELYAEIQRHLEGRQFSKRSIQRVDTDYHE